MLPGGEQSNICKVEFNSQLLFERILSFYDTLSWPKYDSSKFSALRQIFLWSSTLFTSKYLNSFYPFLIWSLSPFGMRQKDSIKRLDGHANWIWSCSSTKSRWGKEQTILEGIGKRSGWCWWLRLFAEVRLIIIHLIFNNFWSK